MYKFYFLKNMKTESHFLFNFNNASRKKDSIDFLNLKF